jgi:hypothetical protein
MALAMAKQAVPRMVASRKPAGTASLERRAGGERRGGQGRQTQHGCQKGGF